ncbi:MAG: hypothetical protein JXX28_16395 [Deltaproteobacteria bacterium]|nr:hypothetical protein [Deltaproteobacteria bacterium]
MTALAFASPERALARVGDPLRVRYFARLDGEGPVTPRYTRRWSPYRGWTFPDGVAARIQISEGRALVEDRRYDDTGALLTAVHFTGGVPDQVVVHGWGRSETLPTAGWEAVALPGVKLLAPAPAVELDGHWRIRGEGWRLDLDLLDAPLSLPDEVFQAELSQSCGCSLEDRHSAWIDGAWGIRYRARPDSGGLAELWVIPHGEHPLIASFFSETEALATGRALMSLVQWEEVP